MKRFKFISEEVQSKILLVYIAAACIYLTFRISSIPYILCSPETLNEKLFMVVFGVIIYAIISLILIGVLVYDAAKSAVGDESEKS